ncbi:hypothetical protein B9Z55_026051 [Caenorhabditis nigoni]|nr:hypothetical protein B9Z55_026051 [Caenorhabditis nigoni]
MANRIRSSLCPQLRHFSHIRLIITVLGTCESFNPRVDPADHAGYIFAKQQMEKGPFTMQNHALVYIDTSKDRSCFTASFKQHV